MKIDDMLCEGVGVLLASKVEVLVANIELNCWKKRQEIMTPIAAFRPQFSHNRKTQTRFQV